MLMDKAHLTALVDSNTVHKAVEPSGTPKQSMMLFRRWIKEALVIPKLPKLPLQHAVCTFILKTSCA